MRLSNFTFLFVLSFADKPKLAYLTRPTKKGEKRANCLQKIDTNSIMIFESKMNLKSISVCSKSIKTTAILISFFRWLKYSWNWYNYLSFSVRKSSLNHTKAEVSMEITFQTCGFVLIFEYIYLCVILQSFSYPFYRFVTAISTFLNYILSTVKITNLCI